MSNFSHEDENYMRIALQLAEQAASLGEVPVGAVLVRNSDIIGQGYNQPIAAHDPSAHAEICALRDAGQKQKNYRLPNSTLYVTLEPCTMCLGVLIHARVERLVFGATEPRAGAVGGAINLQEVMPYNHQVVIESGLLAEESSALLKSFFASRRRR